MRNLLVDVRPVRADQPRQRHVPVVDAQLVALSEQRFGQDDHRRLAEIVRACLEAEAEQPDLLLARVDDAIDRVLHLKLVAVQHRVDHRHLEIDFLGAVLQRAHVLGQARSAEREARLEVIGRQIQLVVLAEDVHHLVAIHANPLAQIADLVGEHHLTACQVLLVYFIISATRMLVLYSGASMFWYKALVGAASAAWLWPTSVSGGCRKSLSAVPSRRNSGLTDTPKPSPYFLPEEDSSAGITLPCVVPGSTVLRTTTTW